jgi:hypothetical protein
MKDNIIGNKYGFLTVMEKTKTEKKPNTRYTYYECACVCGNVKTIRKDHLKTVKSCGCKTLELVSASRRVSIEGEKFGILTAVERVYNPKNNSYSDWKCVCECGNIAIVSTGTLRAGKQKSCGCGNYNRKKHRGQEHYNWKGGKHKTPQGYIKRQYLDPKSGKRISVFEHRMVMSELIGRELTQDENVHHINGIRDDNRVENLELWNTSQPMGQRVEDKINFAIEILMKYKPSLLKEINND